MCVKRLFLGLVMGMLCFGLSHPLSAQDDWTEVLPQETDEILANPGMGWETFHHTAANDETLPAWIPSTVQYIRWGWEFAGVLTTAGTR